MKADVKLSPEAQALEWATEHFRRNADLLNTREGKIELAKMESEAWFRSLEEDDVPKVPKEWLKERTRQAIAGRDHAIKSLSWLIVRYMAAQKPIPKSLMQFAFYRLTGEFLSVDDEAASQVKQKPGKGKYDNLMRNMLILHAITQINIKYGFFPTRSEATNGPSGALIVSRALKAAGTKNNLSESGVEKIWERRPSSF
jgi:hypothetical protein